MRHSCKSWCCAFVGLGLVVATADSARADVDLGWFPTEQEVEVGDIVVVQFIAASDEFTSVVGAIQAILSWDPTKLRLIGKDDADNTFEWLLSSFPAGFELNATVEDGDALYMALSQFQDLVFVPTSGIVVTTMLFEAIAPTDSPTVLTILPQVGVVETKVLGGIGANVDITGTLGSATIAIGGDIPISVVASNPPDGAIDARQPSEPDGSNEAGWGGIELTFIGDPAGVQSSDFVITVDPEGEAPQVASVEIDGSVVTVEFTALIPLEAWTTITHSASGSSVRIGALPGDVSNDGISSANDVLALIDFLNGAGDPLADYQSDIDRSGAASPSDVLRVIDLLNGAGVYDEYIGATLPD